MLNTVISYNQIHTFIFGRLKTMVGFKSLLVIWLL